MNFENWTNGEVSKSAKSPNLPTFKVNFLYQKLSESFSIFFSLKNTNLGAHFLLLTLFDNINFSTTLLLKLGQIFDEVAKLGKSTQDAHNPGKWLILLALLKNGVAEGVASDPHDPSQKVGHQK